MKAATTSADAALTDRGCQAYLVADRTLAAAMPRGPHLDQRPPEWVTPGEPVTATADGGPLAAPTAAPPTRRRLLLNEAP
jgi:hypothetical protein